MRYGDIFEVDDITELPMVDSESKFFVCIGGEKNYQCFFESKKLSRGQFLEKYDSQLDSSISILYQDDDVIIRQDVQFAIPGFYIIATKNAVRRIKDLDIDVVEKCYKLAYIIKTELLKDVEVQSVFIGYDEHYEKPSSTHFWILPIYREKKLDYSISVQDKEFWNYFGYSYKFQESKQRIYTLNDKIREVLKRWGDY